MKHKAVWLPRESPNDIFIYFTKSQPSLEKRLRESSPGITVDITSLGMARYGVGSVRYQVPLVTEVRVVSEPNLPQRRTAMANTINRILDVAEQSGYVVWTATRQLRQENIKPDPSATYGIQINPWR